MPETFYEPIKEPLSPMLTSAVLGEYINSDPPARAAHRASMTQAQFISLLLKDRAEMQAQLIRLHSLPQFYITLFNHHWQTLLRR
jgi:hypothetical protein